MFSAGILKTALAVSILALGTGTVARAGDADREMILDEYGLELHPTCEDDEEIVAAILAYDDLTDTGLKGHSPRWNLRLFANKAGGTKRKRAWEVLGTERSAKPGPKRTCFLATGSTPVEKEPFYALLRDAGHSASAAKSDAGAECKGLRELVHRSLEDFSGMIGEALPADGARVHTVLKPTPPLEQCAITFSNDPNFGPALACDLTKQAEIEPINGVQTEITHAIFLKMADSIAGDYSKCFGLPPLRPAAKPKGKDQELHSWIWQTSSESKHGMVFLMLQQSKLGYPIGRPKLTVYFQRTPPRGRGS